MTDTISLVYVPAAGDWIEFEERLHEIVNGLAGLLRFSTVRRAELATVTDERVFISRTTPNVLVVRDREVVAQAAGNMPDRELHRLVRRALCGR